MKFITDSLVKKSYHSNIFDQYFGNLRIAFMDIETTGLNPKGCKCILGGMGYYHKGSEEAEEIFTVKQYFLVNQQNEGEVLEAFKDELEKFDIIVTFNGNSFDIPFLNRRFEANGLSPLAIQPCQSFDLYWALNKHSHMRQILPNLKQKTVENYLGLWMNRTDEISGAESVALYMDYLQTKDSSLEEQILLHNRDDVVQLSSLLEIINKLDLHEIMFYNGFVILEDEKKAYINQVKKNKNQFLITGRTKNCLLDYKAYEEDFEIDLSAKNKSFVLKLNNQSHTINEYGQFNHKIRSILSQVLKS